MAPLRLRRLGLSMAAGLGLAACSPGDAPGPRPNVILICADTLRSDHLGQNDYESDTTPHLDSLVAARFKRCFSSYPQTAASVASIFTSRYASAHKVSEAAMILSELPAVLAQSLQQAGYHTAAVASNPHLTPGLGFERGFDSYTYIHGRNQKRSAYEAPATLSRARIEYRQSRGSYYGRGDDINQAALQWLDANSTRGPFYLYLHYMDVHSPYISPDPFQDKFTEQAGRNVYQNGRPKGKPSQANRDFTRARYDGGIAFLDHSLDELNAALDERGLLANTYFLFTADHGDEFMEHGGFGHGQTLYREMTQVPLLVMGPGILPGDYEAPVSTLDLFPTICDLLNLSRPAGLQGHSLGPMLLQGAERVEAGPLRCFSEGQATRSKGAAMHARIALFDERWHLIMRPDDGTAELYDYLADPRELNDLAKRYPDQVKRLGRRALELESESKRLSASFDARAADLGEGARAALEELGYGGSSDEED